ncbi:MAG: hemerythrin domain-containing protein [Ginsengibacter sp.]
MDRKPIKRNEHIVKLSRDHHVSLLFCWKLRQGIRHGVSTERMIRYVGYFEKQHFIPHFEEEENILFAPVKDQKVQKALDDHIHILKSVKEITFSGKLNQENELSRLADMVDDHVRYEERILFPYLEKKLTDMQLEEIGKQLSDVPIKDNFEDEFWVMKK